VAFVIECSKCGAHSPPTNSSVKPPEGWKAVVTGNPEKQVTTVFVCPKCAP